MAAYEGDGDAAETGDSLDYRRFTDIGVFSTVAWRSEEKAQNKA
jgi:hypothetical protein